MHRYTVHVVVTLLIFAALMGGVMVVAFWPWQRRSRCDHQYCCTCLPNGKRLPCPTCGTQVCQHYPL